MSAACPGGLRYHLGLFAFFLFGSIPYEHRGHSARADYFYRQRCR